MSENAIPISNLNDFIFCPASIYFHGLDAETEKMTYQTDDQLNGTAAHRSVDGGRYSTRATILQGISVCSEEYDVTGKIDVFDTRTGILTERKRQIKTVYDGYVFQLYAQCFSLREMGYTVNRLRLYSMVDNRVHPVPLPEEDREMKEKYVRLLDEMHSFQLDGFRQENGTKCMHCIYKPLCSFSAMKEE